MTRTDHTFWLGMGAAALLAAGLAACGDDGSSSGAPTGSLTVAITDAPVDTAEAFHVSFTRVALEGVAGSADQGPFEIAAEHRRIDLMQFTGEASSPLLADVNVPAGVYRLRLDPDLTLNAEVQNSWIEFAAASTECAEPLPEGVYRPEGETNCRYPLEIPSGEQAGFRPKGEVTIGAGGSVSVTVEFDLRKNVVDPRSANHVAYRLKPTGLRLVDNARVGTIAGTVDLGALDGPCPPETATVYLYDREDAAGPFEPDDLHEANTEYVTSARVVARPGEPVPHGYTIGFVPEGTYAVALTCEADLDDPERNDDLSFAATADGVLVEAGSRTVQDL